MRSFEERMIDKIVVSEWQDLLQSLADGSIDVVLTDMPYNLTDCHWESEIDLEVFWRLVNQKVKADGPVILTAKEPFTSDLIVSNRAAFRVKWIWHKVRTTGFMNAAHQPLLVTEDILVFARELPYYNPQMLWTGIPKSSNGGPASEVYRERTHKNRKPYRSQGDRYPVNLIQISMPSHERGKHPTQKPIKLMKYFIETYSRPGDLIVDPFCGSGPTAIAARLLNRHFICGDISPEYVELANERLRTEGRTVTEMPLFEGLEETFLEE